MNLRKYINTSTFNKSLQIYIYNIMKFTEFIFFLIKKIDIYIIYK